MRRCRAMLVAVVCGSIVGWTVAICEAADVSEVSTQATQVALFKNGVGYFVRTGELPKEPGAFVIRSLPASSHGTLWLTYHKEAQLHDLVAREAVHLESVEATSLADLLRTRVGKEVQLHLRDTDKPIEGTVLALPEPKYTSQADPYASGRSARYIEPRYPMPSSQRLLLVRTGWGVVGVRLDLVERVDIYDEDADFSVTREVRSVELAGGLAAAPKQRAFTLSYLAKGITWAPSYKIDISEADVAAISGKAAVINEVEDLEDVNLHLVTGFPNLQFADIPSPLSLKLDLAQFFQHLTRPPQQRPDIASNIMRQTAIRYRPGERTAALPAYAASQVGEAAEDFFLYPIEKVSLAKGEVGYYPLFTESVPYKHIYQWTIPDYTSETSRSDRRREEEERQVVWHSIRLQNQTALPWTTAPAMTVAGNRILGQDTLTYTPVGGSVTVKLTRAVAVAAQQQEVEVERDPEAVSLFGRSYQRVTVEGTLRVHNFKGEPIDLEIVKSFSGELKSATPEAEVRQLAWGLRQVNTVNVLTWNLTVQAGEETELTYRYVVLVRR